MRFWYATCLVLVTLLVARSTALKCYYGDSARGTTIMPIDAESELCARYDFACTPGSEDGFCKQLNPPNVTIYTIFLPMPSDLCNSLPPYQNPVCCSTDLCNGGKTPTPDNQSPTAVSPPVATPSVVPHAEAFDYKTTLYIVAGVVGLLAAIGLVIFGVFSRRKRNVVIEEKEGLLSGSGDIDNDLEKGDAIRGRGSGSIVEVVERNGTKYALKKSYRGDTYGEYKILKALDHPNILKVFEFAAKSEAKAGLLMELCDGTLEEKLASLNLPLTDEEVYDYILQLAKAVTYLHELRTIDPDHEGLQLALHGDIKPQNILLKKQDSQVVLKLADFGLAQLIDNPDGSVVDVSSKVIHPNLCAAPEVVKEKKFSISSDLYSFGVVCGQILLRSTRFVDRQDFKTDITRVQRDVKASAKNKLIAEFCLDVIDTEKRPTGGNAKTKLLNFVEHLTTLCKLEKNEHPEQNPQIIEPGK